MTRPTVGFSAAAPELNHRTVLRAASLHDVLNQTSMFVVTDPFLGKQIHLQGYLHRPDATSGLGRLMSCAGQKHIRQQRAVVRVFDEGKGGDSPVCLPVRFMWP